MSQKVKVTVDYAAVGTLILKSEEVANMLESYANQTLASCGDGYNMRRSLTDRVGYSVYAETAEAKKDNLNNNTLLKASRL